MTRAQLTLGIAAVATYFYAYGWYFFGDFRPWRWPNRRRERRRQAREQQAAAQAERARINDELAARYLKSDADPTG